MLTEAQAASVEIRAIQNVLGAEYLHKSRAGSCMAHGYWPEHNEAMLFVGIKDKRDLPDHPATEKGWTVYAEVWVELTTGKIKKMHYLKE